MEDKQAGAARSAIKVSPTPPIRQGRQSSPHSFSICIFFIPSRSIQYKKQAVAHTHTHTQHAHGRKCTIVSARSDRFSGLRILLTKHYVSRPSKECSASAGNVHDSSEEGESSHGDREMALPQVDHSIIQRIHRVRNGGLATSSRLVGSEKGYRGETQNAVQV